MPNRRPALLLLVMLTALLVAACGAGEPSLESPAEPTGVAADPASASTDIYRWTAGFALVTNEETVVADDLNTIAVDRVRDVARIDIDYSRLPEHLRPEDGKDATVAFVGGSVLIRGIGWAAAGTDADSWYIDDTVGDGTIPDILGADASVDAVRSALGVKGDDRSNTIQLSASDVVELQQGTNLIGGLARADLELSEALTIEIEADSQGRLAAARLTFSEWDASTAIIIRVEYDNSPFVVPELADAVGRLPSPGQAPTTSSGDAVEPHRGALVRLNVYLGNDLDVSLTPEGMLVRVGRTDIYAGPDDFVSWQLSPTGVERLLTAIEANPVVASGVYNTSFPVGVALDVGEPPSELNAHPDHEPGSVDYEADIKALIDLMSDPTWLGEDLLSGPDRWVPETLTVVAATGGTGGAFAWPFEQPIREMGFATTEGEVVVCLVGDEVAPVWELLGGGVNHAHLSLDDGELWDANVWLNWPGYRLYGDPCGEDGLAGRD